MQPSIVLSIAALLAGLFASSSVAAQKSPTWPTRAVKMTVPFPPGGGTDVLARLVAERLTTSLGQPFVIENRPGATGNIGNEMVAKAAPDGYNVLVQGTIIGMFPHVFTTLKYDPVKDLVAVGTIAQSPTVLVVNAASPFAGLADLVKAAKADPAQPLNYGTAGVGSPQHLGVEQFARLAGFHAQHITYRGSTPALNDLLGGQTQFGAFSLSAVLPFISSKKLRVLALMTDKRSDLLPNVPTTSDLGFPAVDSSIRFALFLPSATPPAIVEKLAAANKQAISDPAVKTKFAGAGFEVIESSPAQSEEMVRQQFIVWGPVVKELGLKLD